MKGVFASKVDSRVDLFLPINRAGEQKNDRRGDIECNQTLASTSADVRQSPGIKTSTTHAPRSILLVL